MKKQLSAPTCLVLRLSLPLITLSAITLLLSFLIDRAADPILAHLTYPPMLEYIIASLAILIGGSLLVEMTARSE